MKVKLDRHIQDYLEEFALSEREVVIYLSLLKTGPNTIMNLARETGIKRSTTHNNVEELIKKGLVSQTNYGERRMVVAEDPEKLKFLMDQKKWRIKKLEENLPSVIERITQMVPEAKEKNIVDVKYYEGKDNATLIYKEAFEAQELRSYVNLKAVSETFPDNGQIFLEAQTKKKSTLIREIIDESDESIARGSDYAQNDNFEFRVSKNGINLSSIDVLIYDGKVAMINFGETITGTVIINKDYYENSKAIFGILWNMLA